MALYMYSYIIKGLVHLSFHNALGALRLLSATTDQNAECCHNIGDGVGAKPTLLALPPPHPALLLGGSRALPWQWGWRGQSWGAKASTTPPPRSGAGGGGQGQRCWRWQWHRLLSEGDGGHGRASFPLPPLLGGSNGVGWWVVSGSTPSPPPFCHSWWAVG